MKHTAAEKRPAYSPCYDNRLLRKFSIRTLESKMENKIGFQKEIGLVPERKIPLLSIPRGMSDRQGGKEFRMVLDGILSQNCQIVVRGIGSEEYGKLFTRLEQEYKHRMRIIRDEDELRRKMYAASDIALFLAPDEEELLNSLAYGAVPVSPPQPQITDYDPVQESGNAFVADPLTPWTWIAALVRAIETYKLPYDFRTIQRHAMETVKGE